MDFNNDNDNEPQDAPSPDQLVSVVAGVVERRGRWLLAQRPAHKAHAGLWEFPGGKVNPGEDLEAALRRELIEELAMHPVTVGASLGLQTSPTIKLHFLAVTTDSAPIALEHSALGWFQPQEAWALRLAPLDRAFVEHRGLDGLK